jgi:hypothetical protein
MNRREQDAIRDLVFKLSGYEDVDGSACDSGDPLDLTLTEISQGFTFIDNRFYDAIHAKYPNVVWPEGKSAVEVALGIITGEVAI